MNLDWDWEKWTVATDDDRTIYGSIVSEIVAPSRGVSVCIFNMLGDVIEGKETGVCDLIDDAASALYCRGGTIEDDEDRARLEECFKAIEVKIAEVRARYA